MSCELLEDHNALHTLIDDRESCLWVLIWVTLSYSETGLSGHELNRMLKTFDYARAISESGVRDNINNTLKCGLLITSWGEIKLSEKRSGLHELIKTL